MTALSSLNQSFKSFFGNSISNSEYNLLVDQLSQIKINSRGKFWKSRNYPPGIYLIFKGKVRLLDEEENLLLSLMPGSIFGQITLFPDANLRHHTARASWELELGFLPLDLLQQYISAQTDLRQRLLDQALGWDLLLNYSLLHNSEAKRQKIQPLILALPYLKPHSLAERDLPPELLEKKLWMLRRGRIDHSSGAKFVPGRIYDVDSFPQAGEWLIVQPTELYSLEREIDSQILTAQRLKPHAGDRRQALPLNGSKPVYPNTSALSQPQTKDFQPIASRQPVKKPNSQSQQLYFPSPQVKLTHWWQQLTNRYPFRRQHSASDCGVACLVMIGEYWGKNFSITQLRSIANVDRSGTSIRGLLMAAEHLGFAPRPVSAKLPALAKQNLPAIAHWSGNHYVVVYRITQKEVIICDPAIGRRRLSRDEFVRGWTGYTMLLTPTAKFKQAPEAERNLGKYLELLRPHWLVLSEVLLASLLIQIIGLFTPIFTQLLLDRVVVQRSTSTLIAIGSGLILFSLFRVIMSSIRRYLLYHTANKLDLSLIVGFISHTLRLPLSYFETRYVGDITSRINENSKIREFITGDAITTMLDVLSIFVYISLMIWYSWQLTLLTLLIIPIFIINTVVFTPFILRVSRENFTAKTKERSYLIQALKGVGTIKSMGVERNVRWRWEDLINESIRINFSSSMIRERLQVSTAILQTLISQLTLLLGVWLVIEQKMTIGQLIAFTMLVGNVIRPFERLIALWNDFQEILVAVERLDDVINSAPEEDLSATNLSVLPPIKGHISFRQVSFRYDLESKHNTLENLSFDIKPGQTVALVGRSGSGKTTISRLLLGLYRPTEGKILIDGNDITSISLQSLRKQTGVVDQDTFLFGGTILENLTIAHPQVSQQEIAAACNLAGATEFIQELPLKYQTQIGEGGGLLSGGQRQRLAIARALLGKPRLLILDEATSNLDTESEKIIQNNLNTILKNQTTVVIAHRLSTVRNADLILVLDRGLLVESGTHEELLNLRGQYYYLNQQQINLND